MFFAEFWPAFALDCYNDAGWSVPELSMAGFFAGQLAEIVIFEPPDQILFGESHRAPFGSALSRHLPRLMPAARASVVSALLRTWGRYDPPLFTYVLRIVPAELAKQLS